ncbi:MAG: glycosyltransferase [Lentisphaerales bacterium]|nr:glycosyltransferase [Lentisphaerales bacterium]
MRILMVNKFLYPRAGAETYMLRLSETLINAGHEIAFFGMDHPLKTDIAKTYTVKQLEFGKHLGKWAKLGQLTKAAYQALKIKKIFKQSCKDFRPDLIHAHNVYNQLPPDLFKDAYVPVIMTAHDYKAVCPSYNLFTNDANCYKCQKGSFIPCITNKCVQNNLLASSISAISSTYHKWRKTYIDHIDSYIAPSRFMKEQLIAGAIPDEKVKVINNFTETETKTFKAGEEGLLYAGRICREKGLHTLLEAYRQLPGKRPKLTICGTGPLKPELEAMTERESLDVTWTGYVNPARIIQEMKKAKAVIVPSVWNENCSMTIMESLANGRPVIASNAGGNPELINHGFNGLVFKAGDVEDLTQKLKMFELLDIKKLSDNAALSGKSYFSSDNHLKQILHHYDKTLTNAAHQTALVSDIKIITQEN